jgi:hypothetical protein
VLRALALAALAAAVLAGSARADGVPSAAPSPGVVVTSADGSTHYTTVWVKRISILIATDARTGAVDSYQVLGGGFGVTQVAGDGSTVGLAGDRTLVLAEYPTGQRPSTRIALVDTRTLKVRELIRLSGDFTLDAISPNGRTLFLIQRLGRAQTPYVVRAYDISRRRLVPGAIRDRREPDEQMQGFPVSRATSADGRWAYTLYAKPGGEAFVHALDTERRAAWCVDLETRFPADGTYPYRLAFAPNGRDLQVVRDDGTATELVDTKTLEARPPAPARVAPARAAPEHGIDPAPWVVVALAAALAAAAAVYVRRRVRRTSSA